jgi:hypothetical protein
MSFSSVATKCCSTVCFWTAVYHTTRSLYQERILCLCGLHVRQMGRVILSKHLSSEADVRPTEITAGIQFRDMEENRLEQRRHATESLSRLVSTLLHIREAPELKYRPWDGCSDKDSAWFSSSVVSDIPQPDRTFIFKVYEDPEVLESGVDPWRWRMQRASTTGGVTHPRTQLHLLENLKLQ